MASPPPPSTPPRQGLSSSILSSPVVRVPKFYNEHKRDEFQLFGYDENIHGPKPFENQNKFSQFLRVQNPDVPISGFRFTLDDFVNVGNAMAKLIRKTDFAEKPLLVFKNTGDNPPLGHVTDSKCRPDITAAFDKDWQNEATLWPCVRFAAEKASSGKNKEEQKKQAVSYLHYLLLARPDLHVAQGMLIDDKQVLFLLGIEGVGIRSVSVTWKSSNLPKLMYKFIYRLYKPAHFADPSYLSVKPDLPKKSVKYSVRIALSQTKTIVCRGFFPLSAANPFGTRTHVLTNPSSNVQVDGRVLTVLKDQLCRHMTRFNEHSILSQIHKSMAVPGVVEAVHSETIETPLSDGRDRHRLGLGQSGDPFMSIPTVRDMLETLFDVLEVLRYLRFERSVLHRDISKGNILYRPQSNSVASRPHSSLTSTATAAAKKETLCFIKYLLGESGDPNKTCALLIDFNRGEDLGCNQNSDYKRTDRTGTPLFIARAVELGNAVSLPKGIAVVPAIPDSPNEYSSKHPARINKFSSAEEIVIRRPANENNLNDQWRHELEHDAESVFWLLLYWAMVVQPESLSKKIRNETIDSAAWAEITGDAEKRNALVNSLAQGLLPRVTHSIFKPLLSLIENLAAFLVVDRHWLEQSDNRNQVEYLNEAFQRLILRFILDNRSEKFMNIHVDSNLRSVEPVPQSEKHSTTTLQARNAEETRKRPSPQPSIEEGSLKHPRLDPDVAEDPELFRDEDIPDEEYPEEIEEDYESEKEM